MNTLREQIKEVASYCNITPRMATVLHRFFLHLEDEKEEQELDEWINERKEHEELFDLLCEVNKDGTGAGTMQMIVKLANKTERKRSRTRKVIIYVIVGIVAIQVLNRLWPTHPLYTLMYGTPDGADFVSKTVEAGKEPKTYWLPHDSTRIDLMPNSKIGYTASWFFYERQLRVWGSATIHVRRSYLGPLRVKVGEGNWMEIWEGPMSVRNEGGSPVVLPHAPTVTVKK